MVVACGAWVWWALRADLEPSPRPPSSLHDTSPKNNRRHKALGTSTYREQYLYIVSGQMAIKKFERWKDLRTVFFRVLVYPGF